MSTFVPYPAIEQHGVIGDRRTAALVASDGTIDWLCLPDYDGHIVFGAILDAGCGGFWRIGPAVLWAGVQSYPEPAPILRTVWSTSDYELELLDAMAHPGPRSGDDARARVVVRRLACTRGEASCVSWCSPSFDFDAVTAHAEGALPSGERYVIWCSSPQMSAGRGEVRLRRGDVVWMVLALEAAGGWTTERAEALLDDVRRFWSESVEALGGSRLDPKAVRSAVTVRLLEYEPCGSIVAAPTTSLPERIGGGWNADYRLTWVRDASLSLETLAMLGDLSSAARYFEWLSSRASVTGAPLQVAYEIGGGKRPRQHEWTELDGYRGSKPVRFGNHAYHQEQHDSFGYLADCALAYFRQGGEWHDALWALLVRCADYVAHDWESPGNGIWELTERRHYTSSRVMAWVALDRVLRIAERFGLEPAQAGSWREAAAGIRHAVLSTAWSERLQAFRQSTETDTLDASLLLVPLYGFLPLDDPRVVSTITQIARHLTIDGCVYRFDPQQVPGLGPSPMGEYEGAFLPCTFWLASAFALLGRRGDAEDILRAAERVAGPLGLFAEAIDPRSGAFLGNTPLLFSHVEYVRTIRILNGEWAAPTSRPRST